MRRKIFFLCGTLLVLAVPVVFFWKTGAFAAVSSSEAFRAYLSRYRGWAELIFWLVQFISVVLAPVPGNLTTAAGALLFGFLRGFLLSVTANLAASVLVFGLARGLGSDFARRLAGKSGIAKYHELFSRKRDSFLFLTLLLPLFPDDLLCMLAGLTEIPFRRYLLILVTAKPWGLLVSAAVGTLGMKLPLPALIAFGVFCVLLFLLGMKYGDRAEAWLRKKIFAFPQKTVDKTDDIV